MNAEPPDRLVTGKRAEEDAERRRDLLVAGGWLALLVGCLEHDMGMESAAETTRAAAVSLGLEGTR